MKKEKRYQYFFLFVPFLLVILFGVEEQWWVIYEYSNEYNYINYIRIELPLKYHGKCDLEISVDSITKGRLAVSAYCKL